MAITKEPNMKQIEVPVTVARANGGTRVVLVKVAPGATREEDGCRAVARAKEMGYKSARAFLDPPSKRQEPALWLEPWSSGLQSTPRALAGRLSRLLNALSEVNENVAKGSLVSELRDLRINVHQNLQANGWRVKATDTGWRVLPPLERSHGRGAKEA